MARARKISPPSRDALLAAATLGAWCLLPSGASGGTEPAPPAPTVALHDVTLDGLSFRAGGQTLSIPHVEVRGTSLSAEDLRAILDPSSLLAPLQRAARLTAASVVLPAVTVTADPDPGEPQGGSVTAHDVVLTDVVAGKAGALTVRAVDGQFEADPGQRGEVAAGAVTAHAVDAALAAAIATGRRDDPALPASPLFADLSTVGARLTVEGVTVSLDRVEFGPVEGRPPLLPWSELSKAPAGAAGGTASPTADPFIPAFADAAASFKLDRLALTGLSVHGAGEPAFTSALRSLTVRDLTLIRLGAAELEGFAYDSPDLKIALASLRLVDLGRGSFYGQILAAASGLFNPDEHRPSTDGNSTVDLAGLDVALRSTSEGGAFPPGTVNTVRVPSLKIGQAVTRDGGHVSGDARLTVQYELPAGGTGRDLQDLRDAGLSSLDVTSTYRLTYDAATRILDLDDLSVDAKGLGAASLSGHVGAVEGLTPGPKITADQLTARLADATFGGLAVTVTNRGVLGSALPVLARRAGSTVARYKEGLKATVDEQVGGLLGPPAAGRITSAVSALLDGPGTLSLTVKAPPGLTFREIGASAPAALGRLLAVDARTRR